MSTGSGPTAPPAPMPVPKNAADLLSYYTVFMDDQMTSDQIWAKIDQLVAFINHPENKLDPNEFRLSHRNRGMALAEYDACVAALKARDEDTSACNVTNRAKLLTARHPLIGVKINRLTEARLDELKTEVVALWTRSLPGIEESLDKIEADERAQAQASALQQATNTNQTTVVTPAPTQRENPPPLDESDDQEPPVINLRNVTSDRLISRLLDMVMDRNGQVHVGIAAASDAAITDEFRIPIPANAMFCNDSNDLIRVAVWSMKKYETRAPSMKDYSSGIMIGWICGWVRAVGTPASLAGVTDALSLAERAAALSALRWDSEVIVLQEDAPGVGTPLTEQEQIDMAIKSEQAELVQKFLSLVVAGKLTWRQTNHHLGTRARSAAGAEAWVGYLAKVVKALNVPGLNFESDANRAMLHSLIHPWSTIGVLSDLYSEHADDFRTTAIFPGRMIETNEHELVWASTPTQALTVGSDVLIRLPSFAAGFARLADTFAAFSRLTATAIFALMPGVDQIDAMITEYEAVKRHPIRFGIAAAYLCKDTIPTVARTDSARYETLYGACGAYVSIVLKGTTLDASACFGKKPTEYESVPDLWLQLLRQYKARISSAGTRQSEALDAILGASGGLGYIRVDDAVLQRMTNVGLPNIADRYAEIMERLRAVRPAPIARPDVPAIEANEEE